MARNKKNTLWLFFVLLFVGTNNYAQTNRLAPDSVLTLTFPELSPNMELMFDQDSAVQNILVAQLPANYTRKKKFPMVIYIDGGRGGKVLTTKWLRQVFGPDDYICVRLPLFKAEKIATDPARGLMILPKDYEVISKNYRTMLEKLFQVVPNIKSEGSVIGGFSNGAHTTAVLLSAGDDFILKHFDHFYFVEGGINRLDSTTLRQKKLRKAEFLFMLGDRGKGDPFERFGSGFMTAVKESGISYTSLAMRGYGHEFPMDYKKVFAYWVRHQPLPEVAPNPIVSADASAATPATDTTRKK